MEWGKKLPDFSTELNIIEVDTKLKFNSIVIFTIVENYEECQEQCLWSQISVYDHAD